MSNISTSKTTELSGNIRNLFESISSETNDILQKYREDAFKRFADIGLPGKRSEDYKYFPVYRNYPERFNLPDQPKEPVDSLINEKKITDKDGIHLVFINGVLSEKFSETGDLEPQHHFIPLNSIDRKDSEKFFGNYINTYNITNDPFIDLNAAFTENGYLLKFEKLKKSAPVYIYHFSTGLEKDQLLNTRSIIILEDDSHVDLTEIFISEKGKGGFENHLTEIFANNGAKLNYNKIQEKYANEVHINNTNIYQKSNSNVNSFTFPVEGKFLRNNLNIILDEENCENHLFGLYFIRNKDIVDNHTTVDHRKAHCFSNEVYKGILDDNGKGIFNGRIYVRPNAQKTNAFQSNKNIVLTDSATINTKPQLEIWADDVKCSHGATTGQIDEQQMFYLRSRGLSKKIARALLLHAFAQEIVDKVELEPVRKYLTGKYNERLGYQTDFE